MEPISKKKAGRQLGNAAAAADLCGVTWETYQWYVRTGKPAGNPPPGHVEIDNATGQRMYPLKEVRAWVAKRPGRGNWGGIGAKARHQPQDARSAAEKELDAAYQEDHGTDPKVVEEIEVAGHDQVEPDGMDVFRADTDNAGQPLATGS